MVMILLLHIEINSDGRSHFTDAIAIVSIIIFTVFSAISYHYYS